MGRGIAPLSAPDCNLIDAAWPWHCTPMAPEIAHRVFACGVPLLHPPALRATRVVQRTDA